MKNRYKKIVYKDKDDKVIYEFNRPNNCSFLISEGTKDELIIKVVQDEVSENYKKPPIPEGYVYVKGTWDTGFIIERISDKSWFTWVPVENVRDNGIAKTNYEKFGRRNWTRSENFQNCEEPTTNESLYQEKSVKKYGGFYVSTFNISKHPTTGRPCSVERGKPWTMISRNEAIHEAIKFSYLDNYNGLNDTISHLLWAMEYDTIIQWAIDSGAIDFSDVLDDKNSYCKKPYSVDKSFEVKSGFSFNNIFDLSGVVYQWTQELYHDEVPRNFLRREGPCFFGASAVLRGGSLHTNNSALCRQYESVTNRFADTGFRIALSISLTAKVTYII